MESPEPLRYRFSVECGRDRAFELWTTRAGTWWPMATHSASGRGDAAVVIEPAVGGRIYEQSPDGGQFDWGRVLVWEPTERLVCEWLVGDTRTELETRFSAESDSTTVVEIEHRGWERFGEVGPNRREKNAQGWSGVIPRFVEACLKDSAADLG